ncbi:MAG: hypothetical protein A2010_17645 [Nitrospirae bacterium GWD2_57_9]|nr:MAG: hypothetical protein A2010_17645 [Nitrospirae bacterium GWD2_57_9]
MRWFPVPVLVIALLTGISSAAIAQQAGPAIQGKVLEKGTRKPLEGMTVFPAGREEETAVTGRDGSFLLPVEAAGDYSLVAAGPGYERSAPVNVSVDKQEFRGKEAIIFLMPVYAMNEVVVEGERNQDKTSKTTISGKELTGVAGSGGDPLRGMQALPGITTASDGFSNPAIRGSNPGSNFYYTDFLPVGYMFHMGGLVSVVNADLVNDFNIYSSAFGPEFADVTGGVIDVKLRDPRQDRLVRKVNISLLEADFLIDGPVSENQSFYAGARRSYYDLFVGDLDEEDGIKVTQFPEYYDYQGKYLWKLSEDHTLAFHLNGANDQMKVTISGEAKEAKKDPVLVGDFAFDLSYNTAGATLHSKLSPRASNTVGLSYLDTGIKQQMGRIGYVTVDQGTVFLRDNVNLAADPQHDLLLGVEYVSWNVDIDLDILNDIPSEWDPDTDFTSAERVIYNDTISGDYWGLALKDRWKIAEPFTLVIGQRTTYDQYLDIYKTEPRLGAEYAVTGDTLITAGWGKYHELPAGYQIIEKLGNPDLSYIQADHYVLGLDQQLVNGWSAKIEGYFKKLYNLVVPHDTLNYINAGSGRAYGAELLIKKNLTTNWWGWVSAAYAKTERRNDLTGQEFPSAYDQPYIINIVYNWKITPKWTFGAKWRYQSGAPFTPVVGTYQDTTDPANPRTRPIYGPLGSERLPSYHRLDLRVAAEVWSGINKLEFYVEIVNAYNQKNISGYQYDETYSPATREPVEQLPFLPFFGFKLEF